MSKLEPVEFSQSLIDFIHRRSRPFINSYQSLETMVGNAYVQGMNDAMEVLMARREERG